MASKRTLGRFALGKNVKGRRLIIGSAVRPVDRLAVRPDRASGSAVDFADRASAGHRRLAGHPGRLADFVYRSGFDLRHFKLHGF